MTTELCSKLTSDLGLFVFTVLTSPRARHTHTGGQPAAELIVLTCHNSAVCVMLTLLRPNPQYHSSFYIINRFLGKSPAQAERMVRDLSFTHFLLICRHVDSME